MWRKNGIVRMCVVCLQQFALYATDDGLEYVLHPSVENMCVRSCLSTIIMHCSACCPVWIQTQSDAGHSP